jgi:hypothetical protein
MKKEAGISNFQFQSTLTFVTILTYDKNLPFLTKNSKK